MIWAFQFEAQKGQQNISLWSFDNDIATVNVNIVNKSNNILHQI